MHLRHRAIFIFCLIALAFPSLAQEKLWVPQVDGQWWKIASDDPDVSPFKIVRDHKTNTCDFTIWQDKAGKLHLVACIRQTDAPGERVFHQWQADRLDQTDWTPKGVFEVARGNVGKPPIPGAVQAPHAFAFEGKYFFFYNTGGAARCLISDDGQTWTPHKDHASKAEFFAMGRDVCLFRDEPKSRWIAYYTGSSTDPAVKGHAMVARSAQKLEGPWSQDVPAVRREGNPESPFVLRFKNRYYLWQQMTVYASDDPLKFNGDEIAHMTGLWFSGKWAPEIIEHQGQYYLAGYGGGIWLAKLKWVEKTADEVAAWRKDWRAYLEREDKARKEREVQRQGKPSTRPNDVK